MSIDVRPVFVSYWNTLAWKYTAWPAPAGFFTSSSYDGVVALDLKMNSACSGVIAGRVVVVVGGSVVRGVVDVVAVTTTLWAMHQVVTASIVLANVARLVFVAAFVF